MHYFTYIIRSLRDNKYYIGYTSDVDKRLAFHNSGRQRSTKNRIPFVLIKKENYSTKSEAIKRERYLKSLKGGNQFKKLIAG